MTSFPLYSSKQGVAHYDVTTLFAGPLKAAANYTAYLIGHVTITFTSTFIGDCRETPLGSCQVPDISPTYQIIDACKRIMQTDKLFSDMHYRIVETIPEALDAAVSLAEYHSISVLWEGFDVNRYGQLTWIICGYLYVIFPYTLFGSSIFIVSPL